MQIRLLISDFDGTLVDTREANYLAYHKVLKDFGINLSPEKYDSVFGMRYNEFISHLGITDAEIAAGIKEQKAKVYPDFFEKIKLNNILHDLLLKFKGSAVKTALISTARKENILNVLEYFRIRDLFDLLVAGEEVNKPKPDPEAFFSAMDHFGISPEETLIFEDSPSGIEAAKKSGASYIIIDDVFFRH